MKKPKKQHDGVGTSYSILPNSKKGQKKIKKRGRECGSWILATIVLGLAVIALFVSGVLNNRRIVSECEELFLSDLYEESTWPTWDHMPITYSFIEVPSKNGVHKCIGSVERLIKGGFDSIDESTTSITFKEVESNGDIDIYCLPQDSSKVGDFYYTLAEASPVIYGNTITSGELYFYTNSFPNADFSNCFDIALHEILHLFDFWDDGEVDGIMNPVKQTQCLYGIDDWIAEYLDELYD